MDHTGTPKCQVDDRRQVRSLVRYFHSKDIYKSQVDGECHHTGAGGPCFVVGTL
jgi:hypothetical protein